MATTCWYEKNDKGRLLVKCCKGKSLTCHFRLYGTWMKEEKSFQIKSLINDHNYSRAFKLGCIVTKVAKIARRKAKVEGKENESNAAMVSKKYNINVSIGQCRNAKKYALTLIVGNLVEHYTKLWDYGYEIRRANLGSDVEIMDFEFSANTLARFLLGFRVRVGVGEFRISNIAPKGRSSLVLKGLHYNNDCVIDRSTHHGFYGRNEDLIRVIRLQLPLHMGIDMERCGKESLDQASSNLMEGCGGHNKSLNLSMCKLDYLLLTEAYTSQTQVIKEMVTCPKQAIPHGACGIFLGLHTGRVEPAVAQKCQKLDSLQFKLVLMALIL
ncbi:hypothetical protein LXL04_002996 [Taraxacum kok-saghyz]